MPSSESITHNGLVPHIALTGEEGGLLECPQDSEGVGLKKDFGMPISFYSIFLFYSYAGPNMPSFHCFL